MKIHIYVKTQDLEDLNKILSDHFLEINEDRELCETQAGLQ